jgi:hypothetical protein
LSKDEVNISNKALSEKLTDDGFGLALGINGERDDRDT